MKIVPKSKFKPTVVNPDPRQQSAYQKKRDLDLERSVSNQNYQQSRAGENVKYYDLRSTDRNASIMVAHNFTTNTVTILSAYVVEANQTGIIEIVEHELYSADPNRDISMRLIYDAIVDKVAIESINIGRDTIEMWNALERSILHEKS
jgi:hypothetical protein